MTLVAETEVHRFMVDCLTHVGASWKNAMSVADVLVDADASGHLSHGLNRLEMYVDDIKNGYCISNAVPYVIKESTSTAWIDGCEGLGPIVGHFCMELAIRKAKKTGIACVVAKGSNHYGIAGWYARKALRHNMLGFTCSNSTPLMCPTRTNVVALGSNPLSFAAPGKNGDSFVLDMATTVSSFGKVQIQKAKGQPIPKGVALGDTGKETTNAEEAVRAHHLLPLGGSEETAGYKGYGLSLMVETLCGILAGSDFGTKIACRMEDRPKKSLKSHFFMAIDPKCFAFEFESRMSEMMNTLRKLPPVHEEKPVLVPGDLEKIRKEETLEQEGVIYSASQMKKCSELAKRLGVKPLQEFKKFSAERITETVSESTK